MVYDWHMTTIRVRGIGRTRTPIAERLYAFLELDKVISGDEIRRFFTRERISTWEGAKILGHFRTSGVVNVVDEVTGAGPITWRRTYVRVADWDNRPDLAKRQDGPLDTSNAEAKAIRTGGWVMLPGDVTSLELTGLRDRGFEVRRVIRVAEGNQLHA
jgi:hypothetical protein